MVGLGPTTATEGGGGAPASLRAALWLTELYQRALGEAVGCWGGGGAVVVMEKRRGQPVTGNGDGGERRCCFGTANGVGEAGKGK